MREDRLTLLYWVDSTRMFIEIIDSLSKYLLINITNLLLNALNQVDFGLIKGKKYTAQFYIRKLDPFCCTPYLYRRG